LTWTISPKEFPVETRGVVNFAEGYMLLTPEGVATGRSRLPNYRDTWVHTLAAPMFWTDFHEYLMEMGPKGGTEAPVKDEHEFFIYTLGGRGNLRVDNVSHEMQQGSYAYLPPHATYSIDSEPTAPLRFLLIKRKYVPIGPQRPRVIQGNEMKVPEERIQNMQNVTRKYFIPYDDPLYDMAVSIIKFQPGAGIPDVETHVQHHGIYMLSGTSVWLLGSRWHQVKTGDFIWLTPFSPQTIWCTGHSPFSYLLYKDWNR